MKRTKLEKGAVDALFDALPSEIVAFAREGTIYDSSCSREARVYFIDREDGYYLKICGMGTLRAEAEMTAYFHAKGLATEVLDYRSAAGRDYLLTARVRGEDCTHAQYLGDPKRLCDLFAERLRMLHDTTFADCPVPNHTASYLARAEENYRKGEYDVSYFCDLWGIATAKEIYILENIVIDSLKNVRRSFYSLHLISVVDKSVT